MITKLQKVWAKSLFFSGKSHGLLAPTWTESGPLTLESTHVQTTRSCSQKHDLTKPTLIDFFAGKIRHVTLHWLVHVGSAGVTCIP